MFIRGSKFIICFIFTLLITSLLNSCLSPRKAYINDKEISIAAVGDVMCHKPQLKAAYDPDCECYSFASVFHPVRKYLYDAHLTIANLETTLPGKPSLYKGYPYFGSPDALIRDLRKAGVNVLSTANNHSLDTGRLGLMRTIQVANRFSFYHTGTYTSTNDWQDRRVLIIKKNGFRLAFLSYTFGLNGLPIPRGAKVNVMRKKDIAHDLKYAHNLKPDAIFVLYHFGKEYVRFPSQRQKDYTHYAFVHGANVVIGTHPHVLQPYAVKKVTDIYGKSRQRLVAYSLGNFVSSQKWRFVNGGIIFYFDLIKKTTPRPTSQEIVFANIRYEPVFTYVQYKEKKTKYFILPVKEYLKNNQNLRLPHKAYKRMLQFYHDTNSHLARSQARTKRYSYKEKF